MVPAAYYMPLPGEDDGMPAQPMSKPTPWKRIGTMAGVALAVFAAGATCGGVRAQRQAYNVATVQAGELKTEVERLAKAREEIQKKLGSKPEELGAQIGTINFKKPDTQKLSRVDYASFSDLVLDRLFSYYSNTERLYDLVQEHTKKTDADKAVIANFTKNAEAKGTKAYGVTLNLSGAIPQANFVELGTLVCNNEAQADCPPNEVKGMRYRISSGGEWQMKPLKGKPGETVVPITPSELFATITSNNPDILAVKAFGLRLAEISKVLADLEKNEKDLINDLKKVAERGQVFAP